VSERVSGWTVFGLLFAAAGAWWSWSAAPEPRTDRWRSPAPRISPELPAPLRSAQQSPATTSLIRSVEVVRPSAAELVVIASPPPEPSLVAEPPLECEEARPPALLRAGCPEAAPNVQPCSDEGLECRYAVAADCVARYECLYGLWSPIELACPDAEQGLLLAGSGRCEENTPVADSPCADEGVSCGHLPCGIGGIHQIVAECRCGRWYQRPQQCPLTR